MNERMVGGWVGGFVDWVGGWVGGWVAYLASRGWVEDDWSDGHILGHGLEDLLGWVDG